MYKFRTNFDFWVQEHVLSFDFSNYVNKLLEKQERENLNWEKKEEKK